MTSPPSSTGILYQVGGSLPSASPIYVERTADAELFSALQAGEFCYVFNARQMGKSSLRVRTMERLATVGIICGAIDLSAIGSQQVSMEQWYAAIAGFLTKRFHLSTPIAEWWRSHQHLPPTSRLGEWIESVLLAEIQQPIVIFVDEIDSVLSLKFPTDDFFALIRMCFEQRATDPDYRRLTFALLGVTTPSELIADKSRTPFNLGRAIALQGFQWERSAPLVPGLKPYCDEPETALRCIFEWTGGQPFLTQKLCYLVSLHGQTVGLKATSNLSSPLSIRQTQHAIDKLVHTYVLQNWEAQDEPEHLKTIRDRLFFNDARASRLLTLYQQILLRSPLAPGHNGDDVYPAANSDDLIRPVDSQDQSELLLSGLVEKCGNGLRVKNWIYQTVFSLDWVALQLNLLRPYSSALKIWIASGYQDESRLLRGAALQDVLTWAQDKSLGDLDYRFLAASQACDRREVQARLEAERLAEVEARLDIERQRSLDQRYSLRRQRVLLGVISVVLFMAIALGFVAFQESQSSATNEIKAIISASKGNFAADHRLDALVQALQAREKLNRFQRHDGPVYAALEQQTLQMLEQTVHGADEANRLSGHQAAVLSVAFSPDGQWIATSSADRTVKLWQRDGTLVRTLPHADTVHSVQFSPDSQELLTSVLNGTLHLWTINGQEKLSFDAHDGPIWRIAFSPDGQYFASASGDRTVKLWRHDGTRLHTFEHQSTVWGLAFSPDGQTLASSTIGGNHKLWSINGEAIASFKDVETAIWNVAFDPTGQRILSSGADKTIRLWQRDGTLLRTFTGHSAEVIGIAFSPDGELFASSSADKTVKLWRIDGTLVRTFSGHTATIRGVAFSPDGQFLASAGDDTASRIWRTHSPFMTFLNGHDAIVWSVAFNPDGQTLAAVGAHQAKLWKLDGSQMATIDQPVRLLDVNFSPDGQTLALGRADGKITFCSKNCAEYQTLDAHNTVVWGIAYSPDGQWVATVSDDRNLRLWRHPTPEQFQLQETLMAHEGRIWDVAYSADGQLIATVSTDGTMRLWSVTQSGDRLNVRPHRFSSENGDIWGVAISPDSQLIAATSRDDTLRIWNREGTLIRTIQGNATGLTRVAFSPDGKILAGAGADGSVKLWTVKGTLLAVLKGHRSGVGTVAFSPDGKTLASGSDDQTVILWNLQNILTLDLVQAGCDWIRDYLKTNTDVETENRRLCQRIQ